MNNELKKAFDNLLKGVGPIVGHTKSGEPMQERNGRIKDANGKWGKTGGGGEGSRGGHVIGHTRSGKPIYSDPHHIGHADFSKKDHNDAIKAHEDLKDALERKAYKEKHGHGANPEGHSWMSNTPMGFAEDHPSTKDDYAKHEAHQDAHKKLGSEAAKAANAGKPSKPKPKPTIGQTGSGKDVHDKFTKKHTKDFSPKDHADAVRHHEEAMKTKEQIFDQKARAGELSAGLHSPHLKAHESEMRHHREQIEHHKNEIMEKVMAQKSLIIEDNSANDKIQKAFDKIASGDKAEESKEEKKVEDAQRKDAGEEGEAHEKKESKEFEAGEKEEDKEDTDDKGDEEEETGKSLLIMDTTSNDRILKAIDELKDDGDLTGLKNTHGEQFHEDNCKQIEEFLSSAEPIHVDKSAVKDALNDLIKGGGEGSKGGK